LQRVEPGSQPDLGLELTSRAATEVAPPGELLAADIAAHAGERTELEMVMPRRSASAAEAERLDAAAGVSVDHRERTTRVLVRRCVLPTVNSKLNSTLL